MPWVNRHSHPRLPGLRLGAESMEPSSCLAKARKCEESMMGGTPHPILPESHRHSRDWTLTWWPVKDSLDHRSSWSELGIIWA